MGIDKQYLSLNGPVKSVSKNLDKRIELLSPEEFINIESWLCLTVGETLLKDFDCSCLIDMQRLSNSSWFEIFDS